MWLAYEKSRTGIIDGGLVDDHSRELYHVSSERTDKTTVRKLLVVEGSLPAHVPIAVIEWNAVGPDRIQLGNGSLDDVKHWLGKGGRFPSSRSFVAGQQRYEWHRDGSHWVLENTEGAQVAQSHNRSFGETPHSAYLDVNNDAVADLDLIVVSYVYLKILSKRKRERRQAVPFVDKSHGFILGELNTLLYGSERQGSAQM
ncbi:hypothetical protein K488DRAFT_69057 [Vararia minispora EC-137]|uniref:Uncharacterized protein n=1 Tax=Vararia minispora EC-137 TaxID=1314806 RepID=A0ACB8QSV3_9AGAM|nr:hypothetical protein K488DRAFT_69057 [Vararia minispora EC-137]